MIRLKAFPARPWAALTPIQAPTACAGAMQAQIATSMHPRSVGPCGPGPSAATIVAIAAMGAGKDW